jgi:hypothetical protein
MEFWTSPLTGIRQRRSLIGACLFGRLVLRANGAGWHLYFVGDDAFASLDSRLRGRCKKQLQRLAPDVWYCVHLPAGQYFVDPNRPGGGCDLYQIFPAPPLKVAPPIVAAPGPLFGIATRHQPLPRKPIYIFRPTA